MLYLANYVFDFFYVLYGVLWKKREHLWCWQCAYTFTHGLCDCFHVSNILSVWQIYPRPVQRPLSLFFLSFVRSRTSSACFPAAGPACFCHAGWFCARYKVRSFFRPPHALHFLMRRAAVLFVITIHVILHNLHQVDWFWCYFVEKSGVWSHPPLRGFKISIKWGCWAPEARS